MTATSHVIIGGAVGVAVGTITQNPAAAFAAGAISHLIFDLVPHMDLPIGVRFIDGQFDRPVWDKTLYTFAITDSLIAFFFTLIIWIKLFNFYFFAPYAWAALGAYLPDLIDNFPLWSEQVRKVPVFKQFHKLHMDIHETWLHRFPMPKYQILGWSTQIAIIIPCLYYLLK